MRTALVAVISLVLLAACSADSEGTIPDAKPDDVYTRQTVLQPTETIEGVLTGGRDGSAKIHLAAPAAELAWSIDDGVGGAKVWVYDDVSTANHPFVPPSEGAWYLHIQNGGAEAMVVEVRVELYGNLSMAWL